jgi:transposase InsO family protein
MSNVIRAMEAIFRTHGLPLSVRSDNGQPFASKDFEQFLRHLGIEHAQERCALLAPEQWKSRKV